MVAIRMETRILALWRAAGLACLLILTTNCSAAPSEGVSSADAKPEQAAAKTYDLQTREQAAELYNAIVANDTSKVKAALEKGLNPEECYLRNLSAMDVAADAGRPEVMDLLIRSGGDPNHKNKKNIPLLAWVLDDHYHWSKKRIEQLEKDSNAVTPPDSKGVAYVLLQHGADPNAAFLLGRGRSRPVLSYVTEYNDLEMIERLVELGADVNAPRNSNLAPLFFASKNGNVKIVAFLLEQGADMQALSGTEPLLVSTPIDIAGDADHPGVLELFLDAGADPNKHSFLYNAIQDDAPNLLKKLINRGVDVNTLYKSYYFDRLTNVPQEYLDFPKEHEYTPLGFATSKSNLKIVQILKQAGADVCRRDRNKLTAYEIAKQNGFKEIADYLASKGGANCP